MGPCSEHLTLIQDCQTTNHLLLSFPRFSSSENPLQEEGWTHRWMKKKQHRVGVKSDRKASPNYSQQPRESEGFIFSDWSAASIWWVSSLTWFLWAAELWEMLIQDLDTQRDWSWIRFREHCECNCVSSTTWKQTNRTINNITESWLQQERSCCWSGLFWCGWSC